jgi:FixJ family two-component response regulator
MADLPNSPMISIIDDDVSVLEATDRLVRSFGYRAATFSSAHEFLESDRMNDTCCVISDVQMPGLNGMELQNELIARGNPVPIIFITAYPEERIRKQVMNAGAIGFLAKPFDVDRLFEHLQVAIRRD